MNKVFFQKILVVFGIVVVTSTASVFATTKLIFPDVKEDAYYYDAANFMKDMELITGYENGNFGPNDQLTRGQLATILFRYQSKVIAPLERKVDNLTTGCSDTCNLKEDKGLENLCAGECKRDGATCGSGKELDADATCLLDGYSVCCLTVPVQVPDDNADDAGDDDVEVKDGSACIAQGGECVPSEVNCLDGQIISPDDCQYGYPVCCVEGAADVGDDDVPPVDEVEGECAAQGGECSMSMVDCMQQGKKSDMVNTADCEYGYPVCCVDYTQADEPDLDECAGVCLGTSAGCTEAEGFSQYDTKCTLLGYPVCCVPSGAGAGNMNIQNECSGLCMQSELTCTDGGGEVNYDATCTRSEDCAVYCLVD